MTTPYNFKEIIIEDSGGINPSTYDLMLTETSTVVMDFSSTLVSDSQSLANSKSIELNIETFDDTILSDARITQNASDIKPVCNILLQAESGAMSLLIMDIRLRLVRKVGERSYFCIKGSKRGVLRPLTNYMWNTMREEFGSSSKIWSEEYFDTSMYILI